MTDETARLTSAVADRYQIDREIGRGGMAIVYLARDLRHNRNVALKVLNPELGAVLGVERFLSEIRVTANLQHPNLLPLFDSGEASGLLYYVMPYVEGETLRNRLEREKQLPVAEAVRIASAIASALGYAHRHSVIHRDLKPENILLHEDQPLIADFGIALAVTNAGGGRITQTGLSLGTPQYMSPEQATGDRVVDARTDIYSLGAMTYEMLVGDPPHVGSTAQAVIAKLLTEKPASVRVARPSVPVYVDAAIGRALEKLAADRFSTAKEFADALEGRSTVAASTAYMPTAVEAPATGFKRYREIAAWALVGVVTLLFGWQLMHESPTMDAPVVRARFDLPPNERIIDVLTGTTIAVSPDGRMVAYTTNDVNGYHVWVRGFDKLDAREIAKRSGRNLTFSPDGKWLAFTEGNLLLKASVDGNQSITLGNTGGSVPYGLTWGKSGRIFVGSFSGMWQTTESGGNPTLVKTSDSSLTRFGKRWPLLLSDERAVLYSSGNNAAAQQKLGVLEIASRKITEFDIAVSAPLGVLEDQLVYVNPAGGLMAVPFNLKSLRPTGDPVQLEEGVLTEQQGGTKASLSPAGTIVYMRGRTEFQALMVNAGSTAGVPLLQEPGNYSTPRFSPDGKQLAVTLFTPRSTDLWVYNIPRNTFTRVTTQSPSFMAEWSPDGRDLIFLNVRGNKTGVFRQPVDGSGSARLMYQPEYEPFETIMSPDDKWLLFRTSPGAKHPRDILAVPLTNGAVVGNPEPVEIATGPETENMPRVSPDGKWITYQSNESGRFEVYVRPFPTSGARIQVTDNGGTEPVWAHSGKALYYRDDTEHIVEVKVTTDPSFSIGERKIVLDDSYVRYATHANYDVAPDGRFLVLKRAGAESQTIVVHNWGRELREKTAKH